MFPNRTLREKQPPNKTQIKEYQRIKILRHRLHTRRVRRGEEAQHTSAAQLVATGKKMFDTLTTPTSFCLL